MAEDSDLEKTEPASSRRLDQAREEGQVPRSRELVSFLLLFVSAAMFWALGPWIMQRLVTLVKRNLSFGTEVMGDPAFILVRLAQTAIEAILIFTPFVTVVIVAALFSPLLLGSWNFATKALVPDITRMDPIKGIQRIFSVRGLAEMVKAVCKALLVGGAAVWVLWKERGDIIAIFNQPVEVGLASAGHLIMYSFMMIVLSMIVIVMLDVPFQIWQHFKQLKMTKEEVRQEMKEMEGRPEVKGRIRQLQREAARKRMMSAVPSADVIVTNPTHFSVALAYKSGMSAPKVIAKGAGEIALKIREIGAENNVPMLQAPPLARALYRHGELDQEIPATLYSAVAEVLAYIYQLANWKEQGGTYPQPPREIAIPEGMVVEAVNG